MCPRRDPEAQLAHLAPSEAARQVIDRLGGLDGDAGRRQDGLAGLGQLDARPGTREEPHAELQLEALDLLAQRRLRDVEALSGATEVELVGKHHERAKKTRIATHARSLLPCRQEKLRRVGSRTYSPAPVIRRTAILLAALLLVSGCEGDDEQGERRAARAVTGSAELKSPRAATITTGTPYPCDFDRGVTLATVALAATLAASRAMGSMLFNTIRPFATMCRNL